MLSVYGVGENLLEAMHAIYKESRARVRGNCEENETFRIDVWVRRGCVKPPWLFNVYRSGETREVNVRKYEEGAELTQNGRPWKVSM